jgi:hypothetical protein
MSVEDDREHALSYILKLHEQKAREEGRNDDADYFSAAGVLFRREGAPAQMKAEEVVVYLRRLIEPQADDTPRNFSPELAEQLQEKDYQLYTLHQLSLSELYGKNKSWIPSVLASRFSSEQSHPWQVAIHPASFVVERSKEWNISQKQQDVSLLPPELQALHNEVEGVLGNMADYLELTLLHKNKTGRYLFQDKQVGMQRLSRNILTTTAYSDSSYATLGVEAGTGKLRVSEYTPGRFPPGFTTATFIAPLYIPKRK